MILDKPYFNGAEWVVAEKNVAGLTTFRHKFATEKEANQFYTNNTEQQKPKPAENKMNLGSQENKGK